MLHVCLAVSGKELASLDAEEIEGKSAKALKQLGLKELEAKQSCCFKVWLILSRPKMVWKASLNLETWCNVGKWQHRHRHTTCEHLELGMIYFTTLRRCLGPMNVSDHLLNDTWWYTSPKTVFTVFTVSPWPTPGIKIHEILPSSFSPLHLFRNWKWLKVPNVIKA